MGRRDIHLSDPEVERQGHRAMKNGLDDVWDRGTMFHDLLILLRSDPPLILSFQIDTKVQMQGQTCKYTGSHLLDIIPMHEGRQLLQDRTNPECRYFRIAIRVL